MHKKILCVMLSFVSIVCHGADGSSSAQSDKSATTAVSLVKCFPNPKDKLGSHYAGALKEPNEDGDFAMWYVRSSSKEIPALGTTVAKYLAAAFPREHSHFFHDAEYYYSSPRLARKHPIKVAVNLLRKRLVKKRHTDPVEAQGIVVYGTCLDFDAPHVQYRIFDYHSTTGLNVKEDNFTLYTSDGSRSIHPCKRRFYLPIAGHIPVATKDQDGDNTRYAELRVDMTDAHLEADVVNWTAAAQSFFKHTRDIDTKGILFFDAHAYTNLLTSRWSTVND